MRRGLILLWMLLCLVTSAAAQVSIGIGLPGVSIGINLVSYPELVLVPGYPVYYAPRLSSNYFFYDGLYWVYGGDNWYASYWYNGPWWLVAPEVVPLYVLRVPVRYYRHPPPYFRGWRPDAPPRWGQHWGHEWEQRRSGWDRWNRASAPAPAPLPVYQRRYSGDRYPRVEQQLALHSENYRHRPRDALVRQHYQQQGLQEAPARSQRGEPQREPQQRAVRKQERSTPPPPSQKGVQRSAPAQAPPQQGGPAVQPEKQQPPQGAAQREQQTPRSQGEEKRPHGKGASQEPQRGQGQRQEKDREKGEERGQERNK